MSTLVAVTREKPCIGVGHCSISMDWVGAGDLQRLLLTPPSWRFSSGSVGGSSSLISGRTRRLFCLAGSLLFFSFLFCSGLWSLKVLENEKLAGWDSLRLETSPSAAPSNGHPWTQQAFTYTLSLFPRTSHSLTILDIDWYSSFFSSTKTGFVWLFIPQWPCSFWTVIYASVLCRLG